MFGILVSFSKTPSDLIAIKKRESRNIEEKMKIVVEKVFLMVLSLHDFSAIEKGLLVAAVEFGEIFEAFPKEP